MEMLGGELLYAMRVASHGRYNLCPSEVCNPADASSEGHCEIPATTASAPPVEFYAYPDVPRAAVLAASRIMEQEYMESNDERVFYDVNANSNLRPPIAKQFGFDPFERVVDYLVSRIP
jgi:hypothetical protein